MTSNKSTKRALLTSALAMIVCLAMLVGSTFAWFTDTASTGVNKIQAGNLDIELSYKNNSTGGEFKKADKNTSVFNDDALWEPGHVEYVVLKIRNAGSLALKYKLGINIAGEAGSTNIYNNAFNLSDYIRFAVLNDDQSGLGRDNLVAAATDSKLIKEGYSKEDHLFAGENNSEKIVTLVVWMPTTVGNEANYKTDAAAPSIDLGITVVATQYTHENDSFDDQYDKDAQYPITSFADLKAATEWNGKYNVTEDLDPDASLIIKNAVVTLNATGKTIANTQDIYNAETYDWSMISVRGWMGNLTITGGTFAAKENDCFVIDVRDGGYLTIEDGKFIGNVNAVYVEKGTAMIEGGFFDIQQKLSGSTPEAQYKTLLNCNDANYNAGKAKIVVKGGTFVNFDPSNNPEGEGTSFVADGYKVVSETQTNGDVWYTVVPR